MPRLVWSRMKQAVPCAVPHSPSPTHPCFPFCLTTSLSPLPFLLSHKLQPAAPASLVSDVKLAATGSLPTEPWRFLQKPGVSSRFRFAALPTPGAPDQQTRHGKPGTSHTGYSQISAASTRDGSGKMTHLEDNGLKAQTGSALKRHKNRRTNVKQC